MVGFDATELERLLAIADGEAGSDDAEDEVPEPPEEPVSKPGDLWVLGNHRLLCGDATMLADVERVLGGQLGDMTFCDPPYNVDYANTPKDKLRGKHRPILNDNLGGGFEAFLVDACANILAVTKGACYVCMRRPSCTPCSELSRRWRTGASTTIQSLMCLAHGMRRRTGAEGGFRTLAFLDSIDKLRRLHGAYLDAEEHRELARLRTKDFGDDRASGEPRQTCCGEPAGWTYSPRASAGRSRPMTRPSAPLSGASRWARICTSPSIRCSPGPGATSRN